MTDNKKIESRLDDLEDTVKKLEQMLRKISSELKVQRRTFNIKTSELSSKLSNVENRIR